MQKYTKTQINSSSILVRFIQGPSVLFIYRIIQRCIFFSSMAISRCEKGLITAIIWGIALFQGIATQKKFNICELFCTFASE